ncbi:hypothetical protein [Archangium lansingense]|uniref:Serine/threonine protein kinase n=1 Tax=Archangium lansingense TaxID=2995310 RepID=A0ABT3ZU18_9BACT|nr:hypothetical protein [Archangium lansinium]MCY1072902.1 hypothetical protein [Archangium lansinium]
MKPWARRGRVLAGVGVGLALALGAWWLGSGQEVAPVKPVPEPARAVAAPPAPEAPPPAAAAPPVAPRKDSAPVKTKQQQTPGPQPEAAPKGWGPAVRNACAGLTGFALQACIAGQQQVPPSPPAPPPQECPAGALETMTRVLELRIGDRKSVDWGDVRGRSVRVYEDTPVRVAGDWEAGADFTGRGYKTALPGYTRISGRLYAREGRVYGRLTAARTPDGVTYPVCMELMDTDSNVGLELQPGSEPGKMMVDPVVRVRVVDRFK